MMKTLAVMYCVLCAFCLGFGADVSRRLWSEGSTWRSGLK